MWYLVPEEGLVGHLLRVVCSMVVRDLVRALDSTPYSI